MADDEALRVSSCGSPSWLVIAGEIDESTYPVLLAGLAVAEGYREIRIDLSGVRYCDLAGLYRIIRLTEPSSASGRPIRRVVLHAVPSWLAEILQILGWDTTPGIAMEELLPERERADRLNRRSAPGQAQLSPSHHVPGVRAFAGGFSDGDSPIAIQDMRLRTRTTLGTTGLR